MAAISPDVKARLKRAKVLSSPRARSDEKIGIGGAADVSATIGGFRCRRVAVNIDLQLAGCGIPYRADKVPVVIRIHLVRYGMIDRPIGGAELEFDSAVWEEPDCPKTATKDTSIIADDVSVVARPIRFEPGIDGKAVRSEIP